MQRSGIEKGIGKGSVGIAILYRICRTPFLFIIVVCQTLELIQVPGHQPSRVGDSLIPKLACDEEVTALQHAKTGRNWNGVKVFDPDVSDIFSFVVDGDLEQISVFGLQEEEESSLALASSLTTTHLDLVHDSGDDDVATTALAPLHQGVSTSWNGYPVCIGVHVFPYDVVFAADQNTRWPFPSIRLSVLSSGH